MASASRLYSREWLMQSTPSRIDGYDSAREDTLKRKGWTLIKEITKELKLPSWVQITSMVYVHRFFSLRSMSKNEMPLVTAAACFLAAKVEENPRNLQDFAYVYHLSRIRKNPKEVERLNKEKEAVLAAPMEKLLLAERALLYTLGFDLVVDNPFNILTSQLKTLGFIENENMSQEAKNFYGQTYNMISLSCVTTLWMRYEVSKIVSGAISCFAKLMPNLKIPEGEAFFNMFGITQAELDDMTPELMAAYKPVGMPSAATTSVQASPIVPRFTGPANGPPMPNFRPIILPSGAASGPSMAARISPAAPEEDLEEGELPQPNSAVGGPAVAVASKRQPSPAAELSPIIPQSEVGSGEQNNNNDLMDDANLHQASTRKRTRSPCPVDGVEESRPLQRARSPS